MKSHPLRVLFIAAVPGRSNVGGATTAIRNLGESLRAQGHHVDYLFADDFPGRIGCGPWATFALPCALLSRLAVLQSYDILDITSGDGVLFLALRRAGLLRKHGAVVLRSHGSEHVFADVLRRAREDGLVKLSPAFRARFFGVRLRQVAGSLRWADRIICCTRREADSLSSRLGIDREKFSVIGHGVGKDFLSLNGAVREKKDQIIFVGTWVWNKGTKLLAEVFDRLHRRNPQIRFLVAGSQVQEQVVRGAFPAELQEHLEVAPSLPPDVLARRMAESLLLIFPSHYEGFGLVALEAMAVGTPVIMSDSVGLVDWLGKDQMAVVAPLEAHALSTECQRLIDDGALRDHLSTQARAWARTFTWTLAAERTGEAYAQALANCRGRSGEKADSPCARPS